MTLHIVRMELFRDGLLDYNQVRNGADLDYRVHAVQEALFQGQGLRPFHPIRTDMVTVPVIGYSDKSADQLLELVDLADPEPFSVLVEGSLVSRPMPKLREGRALHFMIRATPTRRYNDEQGRRIRDLDIFLRAFNLSGVERLSETTFVDHEGQVVDRHGVCLKWLQERMSGVDVQDLVIASWDHTTRVRKAGRHCLPEALLEGTLVVDDPDAFQSFLAKGIGRSLGFGYGMVRLSAA